MKETEGESAGSTPALPEFLKEVLQTKGNDTRGKLKTSGLKEEQQWNQNNSRDGTGMV